MMTAKVKRIGFARSKNTGFMDDSRARFGEVRIVPHTWRASRIDRTVAPGFNSWRDRAVGNRSRLLYNMRSATIDACALHRAACELCLRISGATEGESDGWRLQPLTTT